MEIKPPKPTGISRLYPLIKINLVLLLLFLIIGGLYIARVFLIPLAFATILSMLLIPLSNKLENTGINRALAALICILLLLFFFAGLGTLLSAQTASFMEDLPQIERQLKQQVTQLQQYLQENLGISVREQKETVQEQSSGSKDVSSRILSFVGSFTSLLAQSLLTLVYLFMLIYYRSHFTRFILKVVTEDQKDKARHIISDSSQVAQQYLVGRVILIVVLAVMYAVGLSIIGLENAILLSLLAALLSIIPYVGNIVGVAFPLFMALVQGGDTFLFLGILLVFTIAQFVESYILEPYIVGAEVNVHPFFTIVAIIGGELVWGIPGMILAIPLFGILKIILENIEKLKPYAFLIGDAPGKPSRIKTKIKTWFYES